MIIIRNSQAASYGDYIIDRCLTQPSPSPSPSEATLKLIRREQIDEVLNKLTPRERDVLKMRFGLDDGYARTLEEVGTRLYVTRERVRQIELRALKKLRRLGPSELIRH